MSKYNIKPKKYIFKHEKEKWFISSDVNGMPDMIADSKDQALTLALALNIEEIEIINKNNSKTINAKKIRTKRANKLEVQKAKELAQKYKQNQKQENFNENVKSIKLIDKSISEYQKQQNRLNERIDDFSNIINKKIFESKIPNRKNINRNFNEFKKFVHNKYKSPFLSQVIYYKDFKVLPIDGNNKTNYEKKHTKQNFSIFAFASLLTCLVISCGILLYFLI